MFLLIKLPCRINEGERLELEGEFLRAIFKVTRKSIK